MVELYKMIEKNDELLLAVKGHGIDMNIRFNSNNIFIYSNYLSIETEDIHFDIDKPWGLEKTNDGIAWKSQDVEYRLTSL